MPAGGLRRYTPSVERRKNETAVDDLGTPPPGADKRQLRRWARSVRPRLRAAQGQAADAAVLAAVRASAIYRAAATVGLYLALPDEVHVEALASPGRRFVAPRMHESPFPHLTFHELGAWGTEEHPWGVRQPAESAPAVALQSIDLLLVPGLLFDTAGLRVGFGKGYYDRSLAPFTAPTAAGTRPVTVGVTYEALVVSQLPAEPHDVAVDYLVTEAGLRPVRQGA